MADLAAITAADFKARFPAFKDKDDAYVTAVLDEARGEVKDTWIEGDRVPALLAYTAYLIASEASAGASVAVGGGLSVGIAGALVEMGIGDVKAKFSEPKSGSASSFSPSADFYWRQYEKLRRRSFPAVMIV